MVETQPQVQPASLRLSAIISQPTLLKNGSNQVQRSLVDISRVETVELLAGADARWPHRLAAASPCRRGDRTGSLCSLLQQRCRKFQCRFAFTAQHARDFFLSSFPADLAQLRIGPAAGDFLCHNKM